MQSFNCLDQPLCNRHEPDRREDKEDDDSDGTNVFFQVVNHVPRPQPMYIFPRGSPRNLNVEITSRNTLVISHSAQSPTKYCIREVYNTVPLQTQDNVWCTTYWRNTLIEQSLLNHMRVRCTMFSASYSNVARGRCAVPSGLHVVAEDIDGVHAAHDEYRDVEEVEVEVQHVDPMLVVRRRLEGIRKEEDVDDDDAAHGPTEVHHQFPLHVHKPD